jgi:hypothetical protein
MASLDLAQAAPSSEYKTRGGLFFEEMKEIRPARAQVALKSRTVRLRSKLAHAASPQKSLK